MRTSKRTQSPQDDFGGVRTRTQGSRRATRAIKGGLNGVPSGGRLANRGSVEVAAVPRGSPLAELVKKANRFREQYNPVRGLTIRRASSLVEDFDRGEFADLMWTYRWIERHDETLSAVVTRRDAALRKLDWDIKVTPDDELPEGSTVDQAKAQALTLRTAYDRISNLREGIAHLALATFRGFAHVEIQDADGDGLIDRLEPVDQWNIVRDGLKGDWGYNIVGHRTSFRSIAPAMRLDPTRFVIREVDRHVDWVALFCFVRKTLSQKDWDAFVEGYGLNPTTVIGPPGVPKERESEYASAAQGVAEHGSGYLPNGSTVDRANSEKGQSPFKEHVEEQKANIVLVGTGGKLTMLNGPTGMGSGQSESHADTFSEIACAEAADISELLNAQFDKAVLAAAHPGQPVLAYFELAAREETDPKDIIAEVKTLKDAGYRVPAAQVAEKTGYDVEEPGPAAVPAPGTDPANPADAPAADLADATVPERRAPIPETLNQALRNSARKAATTGDRDTLEMVNTARAQLAQANAAELAPLRERIDALESITDQGEWRLAAERLVAEIANKDSALRKSLGRTTASADILAGAIGAGLVNGLTAPLAGRPRPKTRSVTRPLHPGAGKRPALKS